MNAPSSEGVSGKKKALNAAPKPPTATAPKPPTMESINEPPATTVKLLKKSKDYLNTEESNMGDDCEGDFPINKNGPGFSTRMSPRTLFCEITKLNVQQRAVVQEMGFSGFLDIGLARIPAQLSKWLVENFDPFGMRLILRDGKDVRVETVDVFLCLGLPQGTKDVVKVMDGEPTPGIHNCYIRMEERVQEYTRIASHLPPA